jgi:hypothetical protein
MVVIVELLVAGGCVVTGWKGGCSRAGDGAAARAHVIIVDYFQMRKLLGEEMQINARHTRVIETYWSCCCCCMVRSSAGPCSPLGD